MDAQVHTEMAIDALRSEVFRYLTTPRLHYLWNPHLENLTPKTLTKLKQGTEYQTTSLLMGIKTRAQLVVTECVQDRQLVLKNDTGLLSYNVAYMLEERSEGTLLSCDITVSADSKAFNFAKPMLKSLAQRELQSDLSALKQAVEEQLEDPL